MGVILNVNYINDTTRENITSLIFSRIENLGFCEAGNTLIGNFTGRFPDFNIQALIDFFSYADPLETIRYLMSIKLSANYFEDMIRFMIYNNNFSIFG